MIKFTDEKMQGQFDREGYVVLPLLSSTQVEQLIRFYHGREKAVDDKGETFYSISDVNKDEQLIQEIDTKLKTALVPELNRFLNLYEPMMSTFLVKHATENITIGLKKNESNAHF